MLRYHYPRAYPIHKPEAYKASFCQGENLYGNLTGRNMEHLFGCFVEANTEFPGDDKLGFVYKVRDIKNFLLLFLKSII